MRRSARPIRFRALGLLAAFLLPAFAWAAGKQTVCTITINSADEQKMFRRYLPEDKYRFVELVERGRPDWLRSACEAKVSCDVLVISGHHGEGNVFFSEENDKREYLPIDELERVSCSNSCPGLFANLKEVYLFGCYTLDATSQHTIGGEVTRSYVREGTPPAEAAKLARLLGLERNESSRDRMRLVFPNTPVIYGFPEVAPLGPSAAQSLNRYFQSGGAAEVGKGQASGRLLRQFAANRMVTTTGMGSRDALQGLRRDVCTFADDGVTEAQRIDSVHQLLKRTADARLLLDRIEHFAEGLDADKRADPAIAAALKRIGDDSAARDKWLAFARDADAAQTRARMVDVALGFGWLTPAERHAEMVRMLGDMVARKDIGPPEVDLACAVNEKREFDADMQKVAATARDGVGSAAILACLGNTDARARVLKAWVSPVDADVQIAQGYLRRRPIGEGAELRSLTQAIAAMNAPDAQARALDALARHYLSDRESVQTLKELFARTRSGAVQNAIAGVLIRADRKSITPRELLPTLREHRVRPQPGENLVDALIERLQQAS